MNRDELAALARGAVTIALGLALAYAVWRWLGWRAIGAIAISCTGAAAWDMWRRPGWWRMW